MAKEPKPPFAESSDEVTRTKQRSPNYPAISLKIAMPKIMGMYDSYKRNWVPVGILHQNWKYKAHSGVGNQVIAALKAYGLIDIEGNGADRKARVSERSFQIAQKHKDQPDLIKKAALNPTAHADLWNKYGAEGLPPDDVIRHYLVFEKKFNPDSVNFFIASFRETLEFAKLDSSDKITADTDQESDEDQGGDDMADQTNPDEEKPEQKNQQQHRPTDNWIGPKVVLDLPRGNQIEIRLRSKVTAEEFKSIKKVYELSELSFIDHDRQE